MQTLQVFLIAIILSGRGSPVFRLRAGHDRRALLDGDGAAQPQEGDHRRAATLRPRSHLRLPPHAPRPPPGIHYFWRYFGYTKSAIETWELVN